MALLVKDYYQDFQFQLTNIIQSEGIDNIVSVYVIGSFACGRVEQKHSDIDLYFVINAENVSQRIAVIRQIDAIINPFLHKYMVDLYDIKKEELPQYHPHHYFTRNEFERYCTLYPTRVLYPLINGDWKLAYGVDCLSCYHLPSRTSCVECLQYDYDGLIDFFHELEFNGDSRALIKYFYRAIKKAAWILFDIYLPTYLDVPTLIPVFDKAYAEIASVLRLTENFSLNDYKMDSMQYLSLYVKINCCYEFLGNEIREYVISNGYKLIDPECFGRRQFWGAFYIEFEELVKKYVGDEQLENKFSILMKDYQKILSLICYAVLYDYPLESILIAKDRIPTKRSRILSSKRIATELIDILLKNENFVFLVDEHAANIQNGILTHMNSSDLDRYIECRYLPAVYESLRLVEAVKSATQRTH